MDQAFYGLDPLEELSPLPMYGEPPSSCLNHLAAPDIRLDVEPFLNTLRQVYKDQFTTTVAVAVLKYRDQILELDQAFPPQTEDSLQDNALYFVDDTLKGDVPLWWFFRSFLHFWMLCTWFSQLLLA